MLLVQLVTGSVGQLDALVQQRLVAVAFLLLLLHTALQLIYSQHVRAQRQPLLLRVVVVCAARKYLMIEYSAGSHVRKSTCK